MEKVNYYHDIEGQWMDKWGLVQLCYDRTRGQRDFIQWAQTGDADSECDLCGASNNPDFVRETAEHISLAQD